MSVKKINWLNHLIELLVVIVGILIAFQLNEYGAKRVQAQLLDNHRTYILDETRTNRERLIFTLKLSEGDRQKIDRLSQLILDGGDLSEINTLALELLSYRYAYFKTNAYRALTDSGDIRFMDFSEKSETVNLYEYYGWIRSIENSTLADYSDGYSAVIKTHLDFTQQQPQARSIYESKAFLNSLFTYSTQLEYKIKKYKDCIDVMDAYLESRG